MKIILLYLFLSIFILTACSQEDNYNLVDSLEVNFELATSGDAEAYQYEHEEGNSYFMGKVVDECETHYLLKIGIKSPAYQDYLEGYYTFIDKTMIDLEISDFAIVERKGITGGVEEIRKNKVTTDIMSESMINLLPADNSLCYVYDSVIKVTKVENDGIYLGTVHLGSYTHNGIDDRVYQILSAPGQYEGQSSFTFLHSEVAIEGNPTYGSTVIVYYDTETMNVYGMSVVENTCK